MIGNLFLISNGKEYDIASRIIEKRKLNDFVMLSWSEKEPYIIDTCSHLKKVMKWEEFQVEDMSLNRYWLVNYRDIECIARKGIERHYQNRIARSPYFIFGLVWKLGNDYRYVDTLNKFFIEHRPKTIYFNSKESFISLLVLSFINLYEAKYENLAI